MTPTPLSGLSWEQDHPERAAWSKALQDLLTAKRSSFAKAKDAKFFCPPFQFLSDDQKLQVWSEIIVWTAFFESSWNPTEADVDVGSDDDRDTWSIGLMQMSVVDQESYGFPFGFSYDDLLKPAPNLQLAVAIMAKQIEKKGVIVLTKPDSSVYWATLFVGGRYDESDSIAAHVKKLSFCH